MRQTLRLSLIGTLCLVGAVLGSFAAAQTLTLTQGNQTLRFSLDELRAETDYRGRIHDPFNSGDVEVRGYRLPALWARHFDQLPDSLVIRAYDGYDLQLNDWQDGEWVLATHINGEPLTLRNHGPARLMQESLGDRDPESMRDFPDWVWMIESIEGEL